MIPKKIHYCCLERMNYRQKKAKKYIFELEKYCPDYEIVEWNEDN